MAFFCLALFSSLALVVMSQTVGAAELTGFGPVKFGMTKQEATGALNGRGEWFDGDQEKLGYSGYIKYDTAFDDDRWNFSVNQYFVDGLAARAFLLDRFGETSEPKRRTSNKGRRTILSDEACQIRVDRLVSIIKQTHNVTPLSQLNLMIEWPERVRNPDDSSELYAFAFNQQAYIQVMMLPRYKVADRGCGVAIHYQPPSDREINF